MLTMNYKCVFRIATSIPSFWQELYDSVLMRPKVIISQVPNTAALGSSFHLNLYNYLLSIGFSLAVFWWYVATLCMYVVCLDHGQDLKATITLYHYIEFVV